MTPRALVLGGGIGGMVAALLLAARGWSVTLLEAGPFLGAGWRSLPSAAGPADLGLRVPMESGVAWADRLVFGADPALAWHRLGPRPREGHVAAGRLNADTPCLDARSLPPETLGAARAELLRRAAAPDPGPAAPDLAARWDAVFGPTLLAAALRPACLSLLGAAPERLAPNAAQGRLPARLVVADRDATELLLREGALAGRLAHPRAADAPIAATARAYLYPRAGGIGAWAAALEAALRRAGVAIRTMTAAAALRLAGPRIAAVATTAGDAVACDLVVLAASPRALKLPGLPEIPAAGLPIAARLLAVEGGAPPPLDWLASYDPATAFLRLGFPDALEGRAPDGAWRILAELRDPDLPDGALAAELAGFGLLPRRARVAETRLGTGRFAVETLEARAAREATLAALSGLANLAVLRPATGGHALVHELVADAARLAEGHTPAEAAA